jgi:alginate O-acetyltransferase complex protein AlgI
MLFCSEQFLLFYSAIFLAYWALPWHRGRVWLLLGASFYFYASWNWWLACVIGASTTLDYFLARGMEASDSRRLRRLLVLLSVTANLGLLCYFKYANFFLRSLEESLRAGGASVSLPVLRVILPIGISFYTFEAINYTVDVYRRRVRAERSLANFMLFILFFPHLVAGPIVRARDFLPQVRRRKRWNWARFDTGVQLLLMGVFKKLAIADRMAGFADPVFANPTAYNTGALWMAALAYALQVYCDFSGYTDIARGAAHLLGYRLAENFNVPYLSANIAEFWRRWHISLSTWFRDYLFIPLGGSRGSRWRTAGNLVITMTLAGLWHGAAWPYVVFGAMQGSWLTLHRLFREWCSQRPRLVWALESAPGTALRIAGTFATFVYMLVIFRAASLGLGVTMVERMARPSTGLSAPQHPSGLAYTALLVAVCHILGWRDNWKKLLGFLPGPVMGVGYAAVLSLALLLAPVVSKAFVYFQF